jgi:hypothetical protein
VTAAAADAAAEVVAVVLVVVSFLAELSAAAVLRLLELWLVEAASAFVKALPLPCPAKEEL